MLPTECNLLTGCPKINSSFLVLLINEIMAYSQRHVENATELEERLKSLGNSIGIRALELMALRERHNRRYIDRIALLSFLSNQFWKWFFGKPADSLEKNVENANEYMIWESCPSYCKYLSVPKDFGDFTVASLTAGILESILTCSNQVT